MSSDRYTKAGVEEGEDEMRGVCRDGPLKGRGFGSNLVVMGRESPYSSSVFTKVVLLRPIVIFVSPPSLAWG